MIARFSKKQIAALAVALGLLVGGAGPACAMPMSGSGHAMSAEAGTMPGMERDHSCMEMGQPTPAKQAPGKSSDTSCAVCNSCAASIALDLVLAPIGDWHNPCLIGTEMNPDGVTSPPALPPPILHA